MFNRDFRRIDAAWTQQPVSLTLGGIQNAGGAPFLGEPFTGGGGAAPSPAPGPGEIVPAPASPKRASWLRKQATALLALRDALLDAEKDAAETEFHALRKAGR